MTATPNPPEAPGILEPGCGPDCVSVGGACRCYVWETVTEPGPEWMDNIVPPF